jgi:hypothetical protein
MNPQRTPDPSLRAGRTPDASPGALGLPIPDDLSGGLGHDAVGTTPEHGRRIMDCLPRIGCVFADDHQWWWVVPTGSQIGVAWPSSTRYAVGAAPAGQQDPGPGPATAGPPLPGSPFPGPAFPGPAGRVRLIHRPDHDSPYTPPIPLYFLTCRLAGITPQWSLAAVG